MTTINWAKDTKNSWTAEVGGKTLFVRRKVVVHTRTVRTGIMSWQKYRQAYSTTCVWACVKIAGEFHHLTASGLDVAGAKALAVRYATTGEGQLCPIFGIRAEDVGPGLTA